MSELFKAEDFMDVAVFLGTQPSITEALAEGIQEG